jgi:hypothetical protein
MIHLIEAIQKLQNNKATGPDGISSENFKHLPPNMLANLLHLIRSAANLQTTPKLWQNCFVKLIFKKGETTSIANYRPIALLNTIFKLWETILFHKLHHELDLKAIILPSQFGSQKELGATDAILAINLIKEANKHTPLYTATIDLSKAYNRVNRNLLWSKLHKLGVPPALLTAIKSTYTFHTETYKIGGDTTKPNTIQNGLRQGSVLSPLLFIIYINDLLHQLQLSNEGIIASKILPHSSLSGLMFVDDLHLVSNSLEGLTNQIKLLITLAAQDHIVLNISKSAIYLDKTQTSQPELLDHIKNCPTLKHLIIKSKGSYLGAEIRPNKPSTYQHLMSRIRKANAAHSEMTLRGFNQANLGRRTITKIITSTISPILTYGLEAFPLTYSDYALIDTALLTILSKSTNHLSPPLAQPWDYFENHIPPPSITVLRNKISLHVKTTRRQQGLTKALYDSFPNNFLSCEIQNSEPAWGFNLTQIVSQYKGKKLTPKQSIKELSQDFTDKNLNNCLLHSSWSTQGNNQPPAPFPLAIRNPHPNYLNLRSQLLFPRINSVCKLCNTPMPNPAIHYLITCQHPLKQLQRNNVWEAYRNADPELETFIKTQTTSTAARIMTGLQPINSSKAMSTMLEVGQDMLCKLFDVQ